MDTKIRRWIHDPAALELWENQERVQEATHHMIDWTALDTATKASPKQRTIGITKLFSGHCATNQRMTEWGYRALPRCARCNHPVKDVPHILRCLGCNADVHWDKSIDKVSRWLVKQGTSQNLCLLIDRRLRAWKRGNQWRLTGVPLQVRQLQDNQEAIGWENFLFGFVSSK